jgi:hypothetical protein
MVLGGDFACDVESATSDGVLPINIDTVANRQFTLPRLCLDLQMVLLSKSDNLLSKSGHIFRICSFGKASI